MNTLLETTIQRENIRISYDGWDDVLTINAVNIPIKKIWDSRMYQDAFFLSIAERDGIVEQSVRTVNALLTDYHYHRRVLIYYDEYYE